MQKLLAATITSFCVATMSVSAFAQDKIYGIGLSPDGSSYAILKDHQGQRVSAIYNADDATAAPTGISVGDIETGAYAWGANDYILLQVFAEQGGIDTVDGLTTMRISRWMAIDKDTGQSVTLFARTDAGNDYVYLDGSSGRLMSILPGKKDHALFMRQSVQTTKSGASRLREGDDTLSVSLFSANLKNSNTKRTETGREKTIDWVVDQNGDALARIDEGQSDRHLEVFARRGGSRLVSVAKIDLDNGPYSSVSFLGSTKEPGGIQALVTEQGGNDKLLRFDIEAGAFTDELFAPASGDISNFLMDYKAGRASALYYEDGGTSIYHLNEEDRQHQARLENALQGAAVEIVSKSQDGSRMIARANPADRSREYYFYDQPGRRLELIAAE